MQVTWYYLNIFWRFSTFCFLLSLVIIKGQILLMNMKWNQTPVAFYCRLLWEHQTVSVGIHGTCWIMNVILEFYIFFKILLTMSLQKQVRTLKLRWPLKVSYSSLDPRVPFWSWASVSRSHWVCISSILKEAGDRAAHAPAGLPSCSGSTGWQI